MAHQQSATIALLGGNLLVNHMIEAAFRSVVADETPPVEEAGTV